MDISWKALVKVLYANGDSFTPACLASARNVWFIVSRTTLPWVALPPEEPVFLSSKDLAILSCSDVVVALLIIAGMEEHESEELAGREREEERRKGKKKKKEKRETGHHTPN